MKYVLILGDGMADEPVEELGGKTPLMVAHTPVMDELAPKSELGLAVTVPAGMKPGSDVANLAVLGYDPKRYYSGRSSLEALSIGIAMKETDIAIRTNLVTLSEEEGIAYGERRILDHSAGEISTKEAAELMEAVKAAFNNELYQYYTGVSYRHCLIWNGGERLDLSQPHDIPGQVIGPYLTADEGLRDMMERSYDILKNHPINEARRQAGKNPANSIWFWGAGTKPALFPFEEKTGKRGAMISAVDLLKGIAVGTQMHSIDVPGADATLETNYEGKAQAALDALLRDDYDYVYVHVEAPDEMGHQGSLPRKIKAIEYLDARIIRPIRDGLDACGQDYRMLIMPDHPTPLRIRTHSSNPVPYMLYDSTRAQGDGLLYNEETAAATGIVIDPGYMLADRLLGR